MANYWIILNSRRLFLELKVVCIFPVLYIPVIFTVIWGFFFFFNVYLADVISVLCRPGLSLVAQRRLTSPRQCRIMYVKSIILEGFKSYAQRTEVNGFDPLFNAITGLNGSGKSNILDSICFLLGISNLSQVQYKCFIYVNVCPKVSLLLFGDYICLFFYSLESSFSCLCFT